jgi:hypothetical protein
MRKVFIFIFIVISYNLSFGQDIPNWDPYKPKDSDVLYFHNGVVISLLEHIGVSYCSPSNRMMMRDSISELVTESRKLKENKIKHQFNKFVRANNNDSIMTFPDVNRVLFTKKEFQEKHLWYNARTHKLLSEGLIIGFKESKIPDGTKPYQTISNCSIDLLKYESILVLEIYYHEFRQVNTTVYFKMKDGRLLYVPLMSLYGVTFSELLPLDWCN